MVRSLLQYLKRVALVPGLVEALLEIETHRYVAALLAGERYQDPRCLNRFERRTGSQGGEDGILAEILRRIGRGVPYFVEFGAGDGENNTAALLLDGFRGLWLDASRRNVKRCRSTFAWAVAGGALAVREARLTAENVEAVFRREAVPAAPDVLSIDIDGNDYWLWQAITNFAPRVVVIEYNGYLEAGREWVVPYAPERAWRQTTHFGASLASLEKLGRAKGYTLVGCTLSGVNAFFVRSELVGDAFAEPFTAERLWEPVRPFLATHRGLPRELGPFVTPRC
jgi:hypothetical protein